MRNTSLEYSVTFLAENGIKFLVHTNIIVMNISWILDATIKMQASSNYGIIPFMHSLKAISWTKDLGTLLIFHKTWFFCDNSYERAWMKGNISTARYYVDYYSPMPRVYTRTVSYLFECYFWNIDDLYQYIYKNMTKAYKKSSDNIKQVIDREGKGIASSLGLADRMEVYAEREAFITLKDHKDNFKSNPSCRLINPAKNEVGIVSEQIIESINRRVGDATKFQQWKNTYSVIDWFSNLSRKADKTFIKFDIVEFYPSITEDLLDKAITHAKSVVDITEQEEAIIWHSWKSLLFSDSSTWTKKDGKVFDVTMGSFDGAEICELVGLLLLKLLSSEFSKDLIGLYRDDGLAALELSGPQSDRARKDIIRIFKDCGLKVTVETLLKQTDFLDVTLDLPTGRYWPFRKPNDTPLYIHAKSNHPPSIIKHLPTAMCSRLSSISCNNEEFVKAKPPYENALQTSGHQSDMTYIEP